MDPGPSSIIITIESIEPYALAVLTVLLFVVTAIGSYNVYVEYTTERSPQIYVVSIAAATYVAAGGLWASIYAGQSSRPFEWLFWGLIGTGLGVGYAVINYGARPASARSGAQIILWILLCGTIGVSLYLQVVHDRFRGLHPDFVAVCAIGALVGIGELVSRYRDEPTKALVTMPAVIYVALNAAAGAVALGVVDANLDGVRAGLDDPAGAMGVHWARVLAAGFGAMAILRSALFVVRTDGKDLQVGLGSLVQTLLDAADRALDRLRAQERAWTVARVMEQLETRDLDEPRTGFGARLRGPKERTPLDREAFRLLVLDAVATLPTYCIALTQNMSVDDQQAFLDAVSQVSAQEGISDQIKLFTVGLIAMGSVGPQVLNAAVTSLANDLQARAIAKANLEAQAQSVDEHADDSEQRATQAAEVARTVSEAAKSEGVSPALQSLADQVADLSQQAAESASETKQGTTEMVATVADVVTPAASVVVPAIDLPTANDDAGTESTPAPAAMIPNGSASPAPETLGRASPAPATPSPGG